MTQPMPGSDIPSAPNPDPDPTLRVGNDEAPTEGGAPPRLSSRVVSRAAGLLPMLYRPGELAGELGVDVKTLKRWAAAGMPHGREADGQMWIEGRQFQAWVGRTAGGRRTKLGPDEAYCVTCKRVVTPADWQPARHGKMTLRRGACPGCGHRVYRGQAGEGRADG